MLRKIADALSDWTGPVTSRCLGIATVSVIALLIWFQVSHDRPTEPAAPMPPAVGSPAPDRSIVAVEASAARHGEMHNVTIFQRVNESLPGGRAVSIISGALYASSSGPSPQSQYCYLRVGYQTAESEIVLYLARKQGSAPPKLVNLTTADAAAVDLPLTFVTQMVDRCRWV
ncbi:MAG TPA: hypothetical protein VL614_10815 [Acetobacteraceae bacterium]|nr:hypothetical protein [Acetobacteraceae bacterium]